MTIKKAFTTALLCAAVQLAMAQGIRISGTLSDADGPIMMGSVGEGFSPLMYVLPQAYRVKREPSSPYDGMIFVPYAHPTEIWPRS